MQSGDPRRAFRTDYELPQTRTLLATAAFSGTDDYIVKADADLMEGSQPEAASEFAVPDNGDG